MKILFALLTVCVFLVACNTSTKTTTESSTPENTKAKDNSNNTIGNLDDDPLFYLHRESCRGTCPGYTYTIFQSGKVDYFGRRHVDRVGNHIATIDKVTLKGLIKAADEAGCKKMDAEYLNKNIADIPRWTFKYEDHAVKFMDFLAPEELKAFCKTMDTALDELEWEKIE